MDNRKTTAKDFWTFTKGFFSFFKLTKERRENAEKPKDLRTWIVHGISEFIGTIFISLGLAGLSIYVSKAGQTPLVIEEYLIHPIIVGFFAGFIIVGLCLFIFLRWSCDLNPSVSFFRYLNGTNNGYYTIYKISIQVLGAICAGLIIYGVGSLTAPTITLKSGEIVKTIANAPIDALSAAKKAFEPVKNVSLTSGTLWVFFVELVMTAVLLFPIFSPNINSKYRDLFIMFIISMSVWMGLLGGTAAINPARGFAQQLPTLFFHQNSESLGAHAVLKGFGDANTGQSDLITLSSTSWTSVVCATAAMILGDLLAPVFYIFVQGVTEKVVNPMIVKIIGYKNYKALNMESPAKNKKQ